ncbi:MAG: RnfABCDGE type electron transport complex subunit G [Candidatus Omnitrophota bacterium]
MKESLRCSLTLSLICFLAAGLLALVNFFTISKIMAQETLKEESSLKEVLPEGISFEPMKLNNETVYYKAVDKNIKLVGIAFKAVIQGYSGTITTLVGMNTKNKITAIKILNHSETPGLGSQINEPNFTGRFIDRSVSEMSDIQAITGATISSKAVIDSVKNKASEITELLKNAK